MLGELRRAPISYQDDHICCSLSQTYIDSPVDYNNFMGKSYWRKFPNGSSYTEDVDEENPDSCGGVPSCLAYQTTQIGNRTLRWLEGALKGSKPVFTRVLPSFPSNITRDCPPSLLILQGIPLLPL